MHVCMYVYREIMNLGRSDYESCGGMFAVSDIQLYISFGMVLATSLVLDTASLLLGTI